MKTTGILLIVLGSLKMLNAILNLINGNNSGSFAGITFIVLGLFLVSRYNKKMEEESRRKEWNDDLD